MKFTKEEKSYDNKKRKFSIWKIIIGFLIIGALIVPMIMGGVA